jgi:GNAT superfamily N-acetyltransferase
MSLVIRLAEPHEAPLVHRVTQDGFAAYARFDQPSSVLGETVDDVLRAIEQDGAVLAFRAGEPIGAARFRIDRAAGVLAFSRMTVLPKERGRSVAKQVVAWLEALALARGLSAVEITVRSQQPDNRPYWQGLGYRIVAYSERYGIADMVTHMRKELRQA